MAIGIGYLTSLEVSIIIVYLIDIRAQKMNSDLLAQMKNKLIKLKQQTQQAEPPSLPESHPPPEQQPQPQPSSHLAELPKNN